MAVPDVAATATQRSASTLTCPKAPILGADDAGATAAQRDGPPTCTSPSSRLRLLPPLPPLEEHRRRPRFGLARGAPCRAFSARGFMEALPSTDTEISQRRSLRRAHSDGALPENHPHDYLQIVVDDSHCIRPLTSTIFSVGPAVEALAWQSLQSLEFPCSSCGKLLQRKEVQFGTSLCNDCYDDRPKQCRLCEGDIPWKQLKYDSGMCSSCFHHCKQDCLRCGNALHVDEMDWQVNLCTSCYHNAAKQCEICSKGFDKDRLWWNSKLCEDCWDTKDNLCKACCNTLNTEEAQYHSNLCNRCYNETVKQCTGCHKDVKIGELFWRTGLCNTCYDAQHICKCCYRSLRNVRKQVVWKTGLCDSCYDNNYRDKTCKSCHAKLEPRIATQWDTGLCDKCFDKREATKPHSLAIWVVICAQFVFYLATEMLKPLLYLQCQQAFAEDAARSYAFVMSTASLAVTLGSILIGLAADRYGPRLIYCLLCIGGSAAGLMCSSSPSLLVFAGCWTLLSLPGPAVRGVRQAFFAKHVGQKYLVDAGNKASVAGIVGGLCGPMLAAALSWTDFAFEFASCICAVVFSVCSVLVFLMLPRKKSAIPQDHGPMAESDSRTTQATSTYTDRCSVCGRAAVSEEKALCTQCCENYKDMGISFWWYSMRVMLCCASVVMFLEISLNAGVMVAFQPVVVTHFKWNATQIASVNTAGAALGVFTMALLIRTEPGQATQAAVAAACYLLAVVTFMLPPLSPWRLVCGVMLGAAAQLMLYPALEAIFAKSLGKMRVTTVRGVLLSLASPMGTSLGTALAPAAVEMAGSTCGLAAALPALLAVFCITFFGCCRSGASEGPPRLSTPLLGAQPPF